MLVLVCNAGSTSLKFKLFDMPRPDALVVSGIERVGSEGKGIYHYKNLTTGFAVDKDGLDVPTYSAGIKLFLDQLTGEGGALGSIGEVRAIGFKTVMAKGYLGAHELTDDVLKGMEDYLSVAPVHNGAYLGAIREFKALLPDTPMIGVFETDFHTTIPEHARLYGIPHEWRERYGIERLGFHGASHGYIAREVAKLHGKNECRLISCHLGGSSSICAIKDGKSVETSFGFSLQSGLPHNNRAGDLDAYVPLYLQSLGLSPQEIDHGLCKQGGLLGISGVSNDLREIEAAADAGNARAKLALDFFAHEIIKYIGSYYAVLGGLDYLVFTAGIGENSAVLREKVCAAVTHMGAELDAQKNNSGERIAREISTNDSAVKVLVIPTNEELGIARRIFEMFGE